VALYLVASALARYDLATLPIWDCAIRLALAALLLASDPVIHGVAIVATGILLALHFSLKRKALTLGDQSL